MNKQTKNKRGSAIDIIMFMIISFVIVTFFVLWTYGFNLATNVLTSIPDANGISVSNISQDTFGQLNTHQTRGLKTLSYMMIFSMALSILISSFLIKVHPAFIVVYLFILIGAIIGSVYISNFYQTNLLNDALLGASFQDFKGASFIMAYLPYWVGVIGFIGMIFLTAGILIDRGQGGGI